MFKWTNPLVPAGLSGSSITTTLDASGEYDSQIVSVIKAGTVSAVLIHFSTVTTGGNVRVSLCAIDATNNPAIPGSILGSGTAYGITNVTTTGWKTFTLNTPLSVTRGQLIFVRIDFESYSTQNLRINHINGSGRSSDNLNFNYSYTGGTGSNSAVYNMCCIFVDASNELIDITASPYAPASLSFNSSTTPDEYGNLITIGNTCRVSGVVCAIDTDGATDIVLYSGGSEYTISLIANVRSGTARGWVSAYFSSEIIVYSGSTIRITVKPTTATSIELQDYTLATGYESTIQNAMFNNNTYAKTSRVDAGIWTDDNTHFISVIPLLSYAKTGVQFPARFNGVS